jgi:hypothetical protein
MAILLRDKAIWFNDVILVPQIGAVKSRKDIPKELNRIICSPMTAVVGPTFAKEATNLGLSVCIPRFLGKEKELEIYNACNNRDNLYVSIGLKDQERIEYFTRAGCVNYLLDIANGYLPHIEETVAFLCSKVYVNKIILGNVTTKVGFYHLGGIITKYKLNGIIRLGLSNGSGCQTYDSTGIGSGQISEIFDIAECLDFYRKNHVNIGAASDGGHKNGGTVSKAFMAGADYAMVGGIFASSFEAETHISGDGSYFGLASDKSQILSTGKKYRHSEGKEYQVDKTNLKPLKDIVEELWGGISSAVSYCGYKTLGDSIGKGVFQIKQNSLPPKKRI